MYKNSVKSDESRNQNPPNKLLLNSFVGLVRKVFVFSFLVQTKSLRRSSGKLSPTDLTLIDN